MNPVTVKAPLEMVRDFFLKPDSVIRLNPSWYLRKIEAADKEGIYSLTLYDDQADETSQVNLHVEVRGKAICYIMNSNMVEFFLDEISPKIISLSVKGDIVRKEDSEFMMSKKKNPMSITKVTRKKNGQAKIEKFNTKDFLKKKCLNVSGA